jgi:uncharacterized membrane protein
MTRVGAARARGAFMSLGPIELVVFGFPDGKVAPDIRQRVLEAIESGAVRLVDALFISKDAAGSVTFLELDELVHDQELLAVANSLTRGVDLLSSEDADELAEDLVPGGSALAFLFEHAWMVPMQESVIAAGGVVLTDVNIPADVVEEVVTAVEQL